MANPTQSTTPNLGLQLFYEGVKVDNDTINSNWTKIDQAIGEMPKHLEAGTENTLTLNVTTGRKTAYKANGIDATVLGARITGIDGVIRVNFTVAAGEETSTGNTRRGDVHWELFKDNVENVLASGDYTSSTYMGSTSLTRDVAVTSGTVVGLRITASAPGSSMTYYKYAQGTITNITYNLVSGGTSYSILPV